MADDIAPVAAEGSASVGDTDLALVTAEIRAAVAAVVDPELRVVTIEELGILRDVSVRGGTVVVTITPTYTGCPAMEMIVSDIRAAVRETTRHAVEVRTVLSPPWTTDWITASGRAKLRAASIAPPAVQPTGGPVPISIGVRCPLCGSPDTQRLSRFGSTACRALWRCRACAEPFDEIKAF